jgi:hypothetical protein
MLPWVKLLASLQGLLVTVPRLTEVPPLQGLIALLVQSGRL